MNLRTVQRLITAHRQKEGGGFIVRRPFPSRDVIQLDPFLLLDEMGPADYGPGEAVGAPDHPHRGFETVTYMLEGSFEHADSAGHRGTIGPGDVQWMTAGRGVVHSEMPSQAIRKEGGRVHGFQLWVNLLAKDKMMPPRYQELPSGGIPRAKSEDGRAHVTVIAGEALGVSAAIDTRTPMLYQDWTLQPGADVTLAVPGAFSLFLYVFGGKIFTGSDGREVRDGQAAVYGAGDGVRLFLPADAQEKGRALLLGGVPLREPVARYGPFVMNTEQEIRQAMLDYRAGRMGVIG